MIEIPRSALSNRNGIRSGLSLALDINLLCHLFGNTVTEVCKKSSYPASRVETTKQDGSARITQRNNASDTGKSVKTTPEADAISM